VKSARACSGVRNPWRAISHCPLYRRRNSRRTSTSSAAVAKVRTALG